MHNVQTHTHSVSGSSLEGRAGRLLGDDVAIFKPKQANCQRAIIGSEGHCLRLLHPDISVKAAGLTGWFVSVCVCLFVSVGVIVCVFESVGF